MNRKRGKKKRGKNKGKERGKKTGKRKEKEKQEIMKTSIQIGTDTRDRLYRLKFRKSYDKFLKELCDLYEMEYEE